MSAVRVKERKIPLLERFGVYYLDLFGKKDLTHHVFDLTDEHLSGTVRGITLRGAIFSALVGLVCVWPTVYAGNLPGPAPGVPLWSTPWLLQYARIGVVNLVSIALELYLLFVIALRAVHEISELINIRAHAGKAAAGKGGAGDAGADGTLSAEDFLLEGPFSITHLLSRAALEIPDPELHILGIDPFKRVSKKDLLLLGLLYKCKIFLTNLIAKWLLLHTVGPTLGGISIDYIALPVECFWNIVVIRRVVREARLRLFGFALSHHIADEVLEEGSLQKLSPLARTGCIRAIGNAVVLARNYHPNIIVLLLRFQHLLHIHKDHQYDDWDLFLRTLKEVSEEERYFLLDLFTIAAAMDGRISHVEAVNMKDAYGELYELYKPRLLQLTAHLHAGRLNAAASLCRIDFTAG